MNKKSVSDQSIHRTRLHAGIRAWLFVAFSPLLIISNAFGIYNLGAFWVNRPAGAPAGLTYSEMPTLFVKDVVSVTNNATLTAGTSVSYSVTPALPAGLTLNTSTGAISGTPTVDSAPVSYTVTATNSAGSTNVTFPLTVRIGKTVSPTTTGAYPTAAGGWTSSDTYPVDGWALNTLNVPTDIAVDSANGVFYVGEKINHRIVKYNLATGAAISWIGKVSTVPTGGAAGCTTTALGNMTPGWCVGGTAHVANSAQPHANGPTQLSLDTANDLLYVLSDTGMLLKYTLSTGAVAGWIGRISSVPTGGAAGCTTAVSGDYTPGWCIGGTASAPAADGTIRGSGKMLIDLTNNLIYISDSQVHRISKFNLTTGAFIGWIGKIATSPTGGDAGCNGATGTTPGWCTGGTSTNGSGLGEFNYPLGMALDGAGYLYVLESTGARLQKINVTTGQSSGWQGMIATSPTGGDAGCNGATVNTFTPGWCTGGTSVTSHTTIDLSLNSSSGLAIDTTNSLLYVLTYGHGIVRKIGLAGGHQGWFGGIKTSPTGGAAGCNGAAADTLTPGWCTGGYGKTGRSNGRIWMNSNSLYSTIRLFNGKLYVADSSANRIMRMNVDGSSPEWIGGQTTAGTWSTATSDSEGSIAGTFISPRGLAVDTAGGYFYVSDETSTFPRIQKFNLTTGALIGWIGRIGESPTGGAAGCSGAAVNSVTPGWCTGGLPAAFANVGDGSLMTPRYLALDTTNDYLYVANDTMILRYKASDGTFQGWFGRIGTTSPTGGSAGCNGAANGTLTPGWCTGGIASTVAATQALDGGFTQSRAISLDVTNGFLYITDQSQHRISKITTAGAFVGWIGKIATAPTGGAAGCTTAGVGNATPGWCTGGTSTSGTGDNMFNMPHGITHDLARDTLYVVEASNSRVDRITASTGAFTGWNGRVGTSPTGGSTGCAGAAVGSITPGWCTGGTVSTGTSEGHYSTPQSVWIDSASGALYVVDGRSRIQVLSALAGRVVGWFGTNASATPPTGGVPGCTTAVIATLLVGYCRGGTSGAVNYMTPIVGHLSTNTGQVFYNAATGEFYIADTGFHRIHKLTNM